MPHISPYTARTLAGMIGLALVASGCIGSMGRSAGRGLVEGARAEARADSSQAIFQEIAEAAVSYVDSAFRADLKPTIEETWGGVVDQAEATIDRGEAMLDRASDSLAVSVEGDLSAAFESLLRASVETAGSEFREELRLISADLRVEIRENLSPAFTEAIAQASAAFVSELSEGVRTELAAEMEQALVTAVGSAVQAGTGDLSPVGEWLQRAGIAVGAFILILFFAWLYRERQSGEQTIVALGQALQNIEDPEVREYIREQIREKANERNVLEWYRRFRKRRGIDR
ncbi:MAG: hypothetical protein MJB57_15160 [Gemmatimonadetes bacterium]|nr:hypothetical protein [Gemmatimonadota bacterium]